MPRLPRGQGQWPIIGNHQPNDSRKVAARTGRPESRKQILPVVFMWPKENTLNMRENFMSKDPHHRAMFIT